MNPTANPSTTSTIHRAWFGVLPLYTATLFLSALLLFWVQPLFGKMALPLLGGAPAVWNTAMMFFQAVLFAGYVYAHVSSRLLPFRIQAILHVGLFAAALILLPIGIPDGVEPGVADLPTPWLLGLLATAVGLPFFALSGSAPLLQRWFSKTGHRDAGDPYFLYAASNLGSLLALLAYPFIFEPALNLGQQSVLWSILFVVLALLIAACAVGRRAPAEGSPEEEAATAAATTGDVSWWRRAWWLALAFVPSSLLLGVTTHITTDVAATPLFWILPLALYLLTFVLVFARKRLIPQSGMVWLAGPLLLLAVLTFWIRIEMVQITILIHLAAFFVITMVCHGQLASTRPGPKRLTEFYVILSLGGVLGGIFNSLVAPTIFNTVLEYPLVLGLSALLLPWKRARSFDWTAEGIFWRLVDALPALVLAVLLIVVPLASTVEDAQLIAGAAAVCAAYGLIAVNAPPPVKAALFLVIAFLPLTGILQPRDGEYVLEERSFFGTYKIKYGEIALGPGSADHPNWNPGMRMVGVGVSALYHGTTLHGAQILDGRARPQPMTYFYREGPFGRLLTYWSRYNPKGRVAVAGLGIGMAACYAGPGQDWTFYEIDPAVTRLALDKRYFTYLSKCLPNVSVIHGDARLRLRAAAPGSIDLLVLDAFSSDAIPIHVVTRNAIEEYKGKLAPDGFILIHITNRHLDLAPIIARIAGETGLTGRVFDGAPGRPDKAETEMARLLEAFKLPARFILLARNETSMAFFDGVAESQPLVAPPGTPLWTDDHSDIIRAIKW